MKLTKYTAFAICLFIAGTLTASMLNNALAAAKSENPLGPVLDNALNDIVSPPSADQANATPSNDSPATPVIAPSSPVIAVPPLITPPVASPVAAPSPITSTPHSAPSQAKTANASPSVPKVSFAVAQTAPSYSASARSESINTTGAYALADRTKFSSTPLTYSAVMSHLSPLATALGSVAAAGSIVIGSLLLFIARSARSYKPYSYTAITRFSAAQKA